MGPTVPKSLDRKLARIAADPSCADFILADAKDADMAAGLAAPGRSPEHHPQEGRFRSLAEYRALIRRNVEQGLIDVMLMSASTSEVLTIDERLFDRSHVTPACRANDTTDIWLARGGRYRAQPSQPFRTATIDHLMCGRIDCGVEESRLGVDLGLYSVTFNNDAEHDRETLDQYRAFRLEAERKGFRHFLEVFDPNACGDNCPADLGRFLNDQIARALAGVTSKGRPVFLKIPYHGPAATEQLAGYDRSLIVGILGGAAGTTFDAFAQLWEARRYGARAALYGRMINNSEHQPTFIQHLRWIADGQIDNPAEAVRSYHATLHKLSMRPYRVLEEDLKATLRGAVYGGPAPGRSRTVSSRHWQGPASSQLRAKSAGTFGRKSGPNAGANAGGISGGEPDFVRMTPAEKVVWNRARWDRVLG